MANGEPKNCYFREPESTKCTRRVPEGGECIVYKSLILLIKIIERTKGTGGPKLIENI